MATDVIWRDFADPQVRALATGALLQAQRDPNQRSKLTRRQRQEAGLERLA